MPCKAKHASRLWTFLLVLLTTSNVLAQSEYEELVTINLPCKASVVDTFYSQNMVVRAFCMAGADSLFAEKAVVGDLYRENDLPKDSAGLHVYYASFAKKWLQEKYGNQFAIEEEYMVPQGELLQYYVKGNATPDSIQNFRLSLLLYDYTIYNIVSITPGRNSGIMDGAFKQMYSAIHPYREIQFPRNPGDGAGLYFLVAKYALLPLAIVSFVVGGYLFYRRRRPKVEQPLNIS